MSGARQGHPVSAETRAKIAASLAGHRRHPLSLDHRAAISASKKGHPLSAAHRMAIGTALRGHPLSSETRAKMSAAHRGRPMSAETRAAIAAALKGHRHTPEALAKMSAVRKGKCCGPNHPRWLGGVSREPYAWDFNDELKEEVRRRDGHRCQWCGAPQTECDAALAVHHIDYDKKNSDPVNLVALCSRCHTRTNTNRPCWTASFRARDLAKLERTRR